MATSGSLPDIDNAGIIKYLSDNLDNLSEVYTVHKQNLESCEAEIVQWKKFIKGYVVLKEKLSTFPDKTAYETMVPIGPIAYMKGQQIHTNEILVHLGDNWFAERSAKDAIAIIDRRKQVCEDNLIATEKRSEIHNNWISIINEMAEKEGNQVEILEEVPDEEYQKSIEKHKEMVKRHYAALSEERKKKGEEICEETTAEEETIKFEGLLKRLDELEEMERLKDELVEKGELRENDDEGDENQEDSEKSKEDTTAEYEATGREKLRRRVSWADQIRDAVNDDEDEDDDEAAEAAKIKYGRQKSLPSEFIYTAEDFDEPEEKEASSLTFTPKGEGEAVKDSENSGEPQTPDLCEILGEGEKKTANMSPQSPADIYKMFGARGMSPSEPPPKGILKKKSGESFNAEEVEKGVGWNDATETVTYIPNSPDEEHLIPLNPPLSESPREIKNLKSAAFSYKVVARDEDASEENAVVDVEVSSESQNSDDLKRISRFKASRMKK